jgi:hypothetical protein
VWGVAYGKWEFGNGNANAFSTALHCGICFWAIFLLISPFGIYCNNREIDKENSIGVSLTI